ncbi:MAG: chromosomal replication initiator protein DnaA [Oscillibacter sp.]|nr:chromosomal replication initiator protein DnaA [Oscillibacter sp.]MBD5170292.1 chromosomal replication initiator protein DnaA [Oscillibacter sp.]
MQSVSDIWSMILDRLREDLSETTIKTWFDDTTVIALEGNELILHCPNNFKRTNIQDRFLPNIEAGLKDIFSSDMTVRLLDDNALQARQNPQENKPASIMYSGEFTFETFVVGSSNKLAYSAAHSVADAPGQSYNPLLIYGSSGLGKTHLLYAIAHVIHQKNPSAKILYIKGDEFINDFIETVRSGRSMNDFRVKYREADLMLVDDIQFVAGKVETQNEFFHTFNTLYESKKQIVLTSDRPPQEMALLDDRLRTRFEWGLMADVQRPDEVTRAAIVKNKAANLGLMLDGQIANYIAQKITSNVRQLEGTVHKIKAFHDLGINIDQATVDRAIQDMIRSNEFIITPENIIKEVCRYFRVEESQIRGPSRSRDILNARQVAMFLIRSMTNLSLDETGNLFGGRDHSTALNAVTKVETRMKKDAAFAETVKAIITNINSTK